MTKEAHTPGPWGLMAGMPTNVLAASGIRVARCDFDGDFSHPETRINARLIAAAPELLAAVDALYKRLPDELARDMGWVESLLDRCGKPYRAEGR